MSFSSHSHCRIDGVLSSWSKITAMKSVEYSFTRPLTKQISTQSCIGNDLPGRFHQRKVLATAVVVYHTRSQVTRRSVPRSQPTSTSL